MPQPTPNRQTTLSMSISGTTYWASFLRKGSISMVGQVLALMLRANAIVEVVAGLPSIVCWHTHGYSYYYHHHDYDDYCPYYCPLRLLDIYSTTTRLLLDYYSATTRILLDYY